MTIIESPPPLFEADHADWLLSGEAVRRQSRHLYEIGLEGGLQHFFIDLAKLDRAADYVIETIAAHYPAFIVPPHARWRHFVFDGQDRWAFIAKAADLDLDEQARVECALAILSVLLDAGAGPHWSYRDQKTGNTFSRSEGLALASLDLYCAGGFSSMSSRALLADKEGLATFSSDRLKAAFQVDDKNPLEGLNGRASLIQALSSCIENRPDIFSKNRLGGIADYLKSHAQNGHLSAALVLKTVLQALGGIWQGRPVLAGRALGDTWQHPLLSAPHLIPFHKLSQWLSYSLFEPMQKLGLEISDQSAMTGLAEYRNGGLFLDLGVIGLKDKAMAARAHAPSDTIIVEWRALTVVLLDEIAHNIRQKLGKTEDELPLASVLEGGTWKAGRKIAKTLRKDGSPPLTIKSDGSVF